MALRSLSSWYYPFSGISCCASRHAPVPPSAAGPASRFGAIWVKREAGLGLAPLDEVLFWECGHEFTGFSRHGRQPGHRRGHCKGGGAGRLCCLGFPMPATPRRPKRWSRPSKVGGAARQGRSGADTSDPGGRIRVVRSGRRDGGRSVCSPIAAASRRSLVPRRRCAGDLRPRCRSQSDRRHALRARGHQAHVDRARPAPAVRSSSCLRARRLMVRPAIMSGTPHPRAASTRPDARPRPGSRRGRHPREMAVSPGPIDTEMLDEGRRAAASAVVPMKRIGTPQERRRRSCSSCRMRHPSSPARIWRFRGALEGRRLRSSPPRRLGRDGEPAPPSGFPDIRSGSCCSARGTCE